MLVATPLLQFSPACRNPSLGAWALLPPCGVMVVLSLLSDRADSSASGRARWNKPEPQTMLFPVPEEDRAAAYGFVLPASSRMRSGSTFLASLITVS